MAQIEEFMFRNVAYRPTVFKTGVASIVCVGYSVVFCFSAKCRNLVMNCSLNAYVFMHYLHAELEIANFVQNCPVSELVS